MASTYRLSEKQEDAEMNAALAIILGLAYVASPGPVNIETLRRGLAGGFRVALALQLGSIIGHLVWAILALAGVGLLLTHAAAQTVLGIAGTGLLLYLGYSALRSWRTIAAVARPAGDTTAQARPAAPAAWRMAWTGAAIATANPFGPAFWLSIGSAMSGSAQQQPATFLGGFFLGALLAGVTIALLVGIGHARITPRLVRLATSSCGLALIGCGLIVGYTTMLGWS
jgi:chemosensory pili system protein ChpE